LIDQILQPLLLSARHPDRAVVLGQRRQLVQLQVSLLELGAVSLAEGRVALFHGVVEFTVVDDLLRGDEAVREGMCAASRRVPKGMDLCAASRPRGGIHAADVGFEEVGGIHGIAPNFCVEVETAGSEAADFQDGEHGQGGLVDAVGELVGVPAVAGVAAVGVYGAEHAHGSGGLQLVLEVVAGLDVRLALADRSKKVYILLMVFVYDEEKSQSNKIKHGVDSKEIQELWEDERYVQVPARDAAVRIISARRSRRDEEELYERE